ncbi:MAG: glycosyltransferase [Candidatus Bathyarchaeota archaeon]|nr:glycosyltransferase [Candidatus Bathyarchaeota archaeon]
MLQEHVSIIVPTYNSERVLEACLNSVIAQTYKPLEVILVDGGSTDRTLSLASKYPLTIIRSEKASRTYQRNLGALRSKGKWLLFLDSDETIHPKLIADCITKSVSKNVDGILIITIDTGFTYLGKSRCLGDIINSKFGSELDVANYTLRFISKEGFLTSEGFNENLVLGEDVILKFDWLKRGKKFNKSNYVIIHYPTEGIRKIFQKKFLYGKTAMLFNKQAQELGLALDKVYTTTGIFYIQNLFRFPEYCARYILGFMFIKVLENTALILGYLSSISFNERNQ